MTDRLSDALRSELLRHARRALAATVSGREPPPAPTGTAFDRPSAAFVTLRRDGALRGCIGDTSVSLPLGEVVGRMTQAAATSDPRFRPVTADEADDITIEVSVLSPFRRARVSEVVAGTHGVVVSRGSRRGLLLPQVAIEFGEDGVGLVRLALQKAGLPADAIDDPGVALEIFEAEVFGE